MYISNDLHEWVPLPAFAMYKVNHQSANFIPELMTPIKVLNGMSHPTQPVTSVDNAVLQPSQGKDLYENGTETAKLFKNLYEQDYEALIRNLMDYCSCNEECETLRNNNSELSDESGTFKRPKSVKGKRCNPRTESDSRILSGYRFRFRFVTEDGRRKKIIQ